jgi:hypothetical protein
MIEPRRRARHSLDVLLRATSNLPFFKNLMAEPGFAENNIHEELCKRMILVDDVKGDTVIKRSMASLIETKKRIDSSYCSVEM